MKASLQPGVTHAQTIEVDRDRTISFMGEEGRVYGTPYMVRDMEQTCRLLLQQHADAGEDSVGMEISVKHLAPTPLGWNVTVTAKVTAVEGRKVSFELTARDDLDQIGTATHDRFVVDVAKTQERLAAKKAKRPGK